MGRTVLVLEGRLVAAGRDSLGRTLLTEAERFSYGARIREAELVPDLSSSHRLVLIQMAKMAARGICFATQEVIRKRAGLKSVRTVGRAWVVLRERGLIVPKVMSVFRTRGWVVLPSVRTGHYVGLTQTKFRNEGGQNVRQNEDRNQEGIADQRLQPLIDVTVAAGQAVSASQFKDLVASIAAGKRPPGCQPGGYKKNTFN